MTPRSMVSSTKPAALRSSQVPLDVAHTISDFGYEPRRALMAGSKASVGPNGDASITSIELAGLIDDVGCNRSHSNGLCLDVDSQDQNIISKFRL
jgi:hypothetical protein